jgi:ParB family chromosome partitioning protein
MLAKKLGKSRVAVTESLALQAMPDEVKNLCRLADITSKSLLLQVVRQGEPEKMVALIEKIATQGGVTREEVRKQTAKPKVGRPRAFIFSYRPPTKAFNLKLSFRKGKADRAEVIAALQAIIEDLRNQG